MQVSSELFSVTEAAPSGIVFPGESGSTVCEISKALFDLGLCKTEDQSIMNEDITEALNRFRRANNLPEAEYADPVSLSVLLPDHIFGGRDIMLLAALSEKSLPDGSGISRFEFCREQINGAKLSGCSLYRYISVKYNADRFSSVFPDAETLRAAVLASLLEAY